MKKHSIPGIEQALEEIANLPKPVIDTDTALAKFKYTINIAIQRGHKLPLILSIINKHQKKHDGEEFTLDQLAESINKPTKKGKSKKLDHEKQSISQ